MFNKKHADLKFQQGALSGFGVLAKQSDLNPITITRELIQNSLDAAREAEREPAIIRFEVAKHKPSDIPAFDTYKAALRRAEKNHRKSGSDESSNTAQSVVNAMTTQTKAKEIETLFVMDNGIGLNENRMAALLAEGISDKSAAASGSYGYGHTAIIPASDLRYILYGGLCAGKKIAAGHAVLASFEDKDGTLKGKDGYFVSEITNKIKKPFKYPQNKEIPDIIKDKLDTIKKEMGDSGSVVAILGFNHFREEKKLWNAIKKAVACNFFVAVAEGSLQVEYKEGEEKHILDKGAIGDILEEYKEQKRAKDFLAGSKAYKAYETMVAGESYSAKTALGDIKIKVRALPPGERSQIDLCRNGMHISNNIPELKQYHFADYAPFHCLIMVDASDGEFHRLIRKAEPPEHNGIEMKKLDKKEKKALKGALINIREFIKTKLEKLENEQFSISDVLNLNTQGVDTLDELPPRVRASSNKNEGHRNPSNPTSPVETKSRTGGFKRAGTAVLFHAAAVQTGKRSYAVQLALSENKYDSEIRFAVDESLDLTCADTNAEDFVSLINVKIDDSPAAEEQLIKDDSGNVLGINLGKTKTQSTMKLAFDFALPDSADVSDDTQVSLQAEMVQRKLEKEA